MVSKQVLNWPNKSPYFEHEECKLQRFKLLLLYYASPVDYRADITKATKLIHREFQKKFQQNYIMSCVTTRNDWGLDVFPSNEERVVSL